MEIEREIPITAKFVKVSEDRFGNQSLTYDPMTNDYFGEWVCLELPKGKWQIIGSYELEGKRFIELIEK